MKYLLDTNTCIDFMRGSYQSLVNKFDSMDDKSLALCSIVYNELIFGAMKSKKQARNIAVVRAFASKSKIFPYDDNAAELYGRIRFQLEKHGNMIGANDLLIAAIAMQHNLTLVTHNTKEFCRIDGLNLEDWVEN